MLVRLVSDYGDTALGDLVAVATVGFRIEANGMQLGNFDPGVHDGTAQTAVTADLHAGHQNRILHFAITVHAHAGREDAVQHAATGNDAAGADDGIERESHAAALLGE